MQAPACAWLLLFQFHQANAGDRLYLAERFDGGRRVPVILRVDLDDSQRLALGHALRSGRPAQREVRNIQGVLAQNGSDAPNYAGHVVVANRHQRALQRRLDVDAVVGEQAGRGTAQTRSKPGCIAARGMQRDLQCASRAARGELLLVLLNANAAFLRDGCRVNPIDHFRVRKYATDRCVANQLGLALGEPARVGDLNGFQIPRYRMRQEQPQTFRHVDVRRDLLVLFVRERRQVDRVLHHAELQVVAHLHRQLNADRLLHLIRRTPYVRRQQHVVQAEVRRILQRLMAKDIQRRTGDVARADGISKSFVDDQFTPRAVDDANARFHDLDRCGIDHALGLRGQADVQRKIVGSLEDVVDGHQRDLILPRDDWRDERVVAEY